MKEQYEAPKTEVILLEEEKGRRKEIGEDMVNLVIGGLADTCKTSTSTSTSKSSSQRKRKRDDILLPEI